MEAEYINDLSDLYAPTTVPCMEEEQMDEEQPRRIDLKNKNDDTISDKLLALLTVNPDTLVK
jgi:hypothetical protein